ncbi:MAG: N-acetylmuramoyl-L-alanine amidase CwlD [Bacillaceae bacterium]|nr:N-acetylmuramoyl-L-alanine amidase CwlD [Bacillaceae bacterium]
MLLLIIKIPLTKDSTAQFGLPLAGKIIVIDPGHGGIDGGASSKEGLLEKEVALSISLLLRDYLQEAGALVIMTREEDKDLAEQDTKRIRSRKIQDLKRRVQMINETDSDLFVSIHLNAIPSPKWSGAQTFYNRSIDSNERLARLIQAELRDNLNNTNRLAKPINNVFLLKEAQTTGALVEVGFLSNPTEAELLETIEYQQKVAVSIYQGISRYYTNESTPAH